MKRTLIIYILAITGIFSFSSFTKAEELTPDNTIIVVTKKYPVGVRFLYKWLNKIYNYEKGVNRRFPVLREFTELRKDTDTTGKIILSIGNNHFNKDVEVENLPPHSFVIKRNGNLVAIKGSDEIGTNIGITWFLDHICGVRFYLPGDLFTSFPASETITLPSDIDVKEVPFTKYVLATGLWKKPNGVGDDITQWESFWAKMNGLMRKNWGSHQHSMGDRFFDDTLFNLYPEIFPIIDGKKYFPKSKKDQKWEPDFAEPKLVDAAVYSTIQFFKSRPELDHIAFSVQDSWIYPTEGKMGKYLKNYPDTKQGKYRGYTNAYVTFLNKFAERLEEELPKNGVTRPKTIVYIVYGNVRLVPEENLHPSILPVTVYHVAESLMDSLYNENRALNLWSEVTNQIGNHDWAEGRGYIYPRIYTNLVSKFVRTIRDENMEMGYAHIEAYPNWSLGGPKFYLMSKLYWNPLVNTDSLMNLFCTDMFGNAGKIMMEYFTTIEDLNTSMNNSPEKNRRLGNYLTQLSLNDHEFTQVLKARGLLNKAIKTKRTSQNEKERIHFFSKGFRIYEGLLEIYQSIVVDNYKVNQYKEFLRNEIAGNQMMLFDATDKNFLKYMDAVIDKIVKAKK